MTREEAIDILRSYLMFDKSNMQIDIALNMAIEALQGDVIEFDFNKHKPRVRNKVYDERGFVKVVQCKDCRHANECHKSVQYTRNEQNTVTIGYSPIEWCSRGERK